MKKMLCAAIIILCALLFLAACGVNIPEPAAAPAETITATANQAPTIAQRPGLPQLTVQQSHPVLSRVLPPVQAMQGAASWTFGDGTAIVFDAPHPLQLSLDRYDEATVSGTHMYLVFDNPPQLVEVRRWPQGEKRSEQYETVETASAENPWAFTQGGGDYIYEVTAAWPNGSRIHYAFRATN